MLPTTLCPPMSVRRLSARYAGAPANPSPSRQRWWCASMIGRFGSSGSSRVNLTQSSCDSDANLLSPPFGAASRGFELGEACLDVLMIRGLIEGDWQALEPPHSEEGPPL